MSPQYCICLGGWDLIKARNFLRLFCSITLLALCGCSSFSKLTAIGANATDGPVASDCGSCHVSQFNEWSLSRHALAYQNSVFQAEYREDGDETCLVCHAPLLVRHDESLPRSYDRTGGVNCISCHYSGGKMHGPHPATALFQPHPVEEKDAFYLGVSLCARCHGETSEEYQTTARARTLPTCLECHAARVSRTPSQGTDFFSDILVSFEEQVATRSHDISLDALKTNPSLLPLNVRYTQDNSGQIEVAVINNLPHNLPTGTFGQKSVKLFVQASPGTGSNGRAASLVADEAHPLGPGASAKIRLGTSFLPSEGTLLIRLERFGAPDDTRPPAVLASQSIALRLHNAK